MAIEPILPALDQALALLPGAMDSPYARIQLIATGLQESLLQHRRQLVGRPPRPVGPAKGLLQFEEGGGCRGVLRHAASRYWMHSVCRARGVEPEPRPLWDALERDDVLAFAAGRLLIFTDPRRLPAEEQAGWDLYLRTWRPGAWDRGTAAERASLRRKWARNYAQATAATHALA